MKENKPKLEKKKKDSRLADAFRTKNISEADYGLSFWFGAIFFYLLSFGKIPFDELHSKQYKNRNLWVGWLFRMVLLGIGLGIVLVLFN